MSNDSSDQINSNVPWQPWLGVILAIIIFIGAQILAGIVMSLVPVLLGWSDGHAKNWLNHSLAAHVIFYLLIGLFIVFATRLFLKWQSTDWRAIGFRRPKSSDPLYSLAGFPIYIVSFALITALIKALVPSLNIGQAQDLGFNSSYHGIQLFLIGLALIVIAPVTEEIIFRGLIFGSLKKSLPIIYAAILTSLLFAAGHLLEGGSGGLLYIAAIDTFVLSMVLVYLRQKTGGLWSSIGLHALKNSIAFVSLFVFHMH